MAASDHAFSDSLKAEGNTAFAAGDHGKAIDCYSRAIELVGSEGANVHVLYSNRAAAYLARAGSGDALAALSDANASIRLNATFAKAYGRKGNALLALRQPEEAYAAFQAGIKVEPANAALREGMAAAQAAIAASRTGTAAAAPSRPAAPAVVASAPAPAASSSAGGSGAGAGGGANSSASEPMRQPAAEEEDPLAAFLNDVEGTASAVEAERKAREATHAPLSVLTEQDRKVGTEAAAVAELPSLVGGAPARSNLESILGGHSTALTFDRLTQAAAEQAAQEGKTGPAHLSTGREYELQGKEAEAQSKALAEQDLGDGDAQAERLTGRFSEWSNLNPFAVLQLPHSANEDDIKGRYRRISALVHPDKCGHARANDAFQAVKKAYDALLDPNRRRLAAGLIHNVMKEVKKGRKKRGAGSGAAVTVAHGNGSSAAASSSAKPSVAAGAGASGAGAGASSSSAAAGSKVAASSARAGPAPDFSALPGLAETEDEEVQREVMKAFADVEQRRRNYETRIKAQAEREANEAARQLEEQADQAKADQEWAKGRDDRKVAWHAFDGDAKRRKLGEGGLHVSDAIRFGATARPGQGFGPRPTGAGAGAGAPAAADADTDAVGEEYRKKWR